jgi:hypothetical protein
MARPTFKDLTTEVRAVLSVTEDQAYAWLLDRARVLNAETSWLFITGTASMSGDVAGRYYVLPDTIVWIEAILVDGLPYQRSTPHALDARWTGNTGNTAGIYSIASSSSFQIHPPVFKDVEIRSVVDVTDDRTLAPPFPTDFDQSLIDGRFATAVDRLKRRRHGRGGRGATSIRVVQ